MRFGGSGTNRERIGTNDTAASSAPLPVLRKRSGVENPFYSRYAPNLSRAHRAAVVLSVGPRRAVAQPDSQRAATDIDANVTPAVHTYSLDREQDM